MFYEIPEATYDLDGLPKEPFSLMDNDIATHTSTLKYSINSEFMQRGTFKMAHPGSVHLNGEAYLLPFTSGTICVKQYKATMVVLEE